MATETITLYELCQRAADSIEARPLNYHQEYWSRPAENLSALVKDIAKGNAASGELCGTVFCRAGWMVAHIDQPKSPERWRAEEASDTEYAGARMEALLREAGVPDYSIANLFGGGALDAVGVSEHAYGTAKYAEAGAKGLRDFAEAHKDKLQAATVEVWVDDAPPEARCQ